MAKPILIVYINPHLSLQDDLLKTIKKTIKDSIDNEYHVVIVKANKGDVQFHSVEGELKETSYIHGGTIK